MAYWLMKSEPGTYSFDDLARDRVTCWEGVRNYQVRNLMRDEMQKGDLAFFYHSACPEPGIAGIMSIARGAYPDDTQFDARSKYHDAKSDPDNPRWLMVDVRYKRRLKRFISLAELRATKGLAGLALLQKGSRLSITPVSAQHFERILELEQSPG